MKKHNKHNFLLLTLLASMVLPAISSCSLFGGDIPNPTPNENTDQNQNEDNKDPDNNKPGDNEDNKDPEKPETPDKPGGNEDNNKPIEQIKGELKNIVYDDVTNIIKFEKTSTVTLVRYTIYNGDRKISEDSTTESEFKVRIYKQNETTNHYKAILVAQSSSSEEIEYTFEFDDTLIKLATPKNFKVDTLTQTISWDAVEGAEGYKVEFIQNEHKKSFSTSGTSYTYKVSELELGGEYKVNIYSTSTDEDRYDYSDPLVGKITIPELEKVNLSVSSDGLSIIIDSKYDYFEYKTSSNGDVHRTSNKVIPIKKLSLNKETNSYYLEVKAVSKDGMVAASKATKITYEIPTLVRKDNVKVKDIYELAAEKTKTSLKELFPNYTDFKFLAFSKSDNTLYFEFVNETKIYHGQVSFPFLAIDTQDSYKLDDAYELLQIYKESKDDIYNIVEVCEPSLRKAIINGGYKYNGFEDGWLWNLEKSDPYEYLMVPTLQAVTRTTSMRYCRLIDNGSLVEGFLVEWYGGPHGDGSEDLGQHFADRYFVNRIGGYICDSLNTDVSGAIEYDRYVRMLENKISRVISNRKEINKPSIIKIKSIDTNTGIVYFESYNSNDVDSGQAYVSSLKFSNPEEINRFEIIDRIRYADINDSNVTPVKLSYSVHETKVIMAKLFEHNLLKTDVSLHITQIKYATMNRQIHSRDELYEFIVVTKSNKVLKGTVSFHNNARPDGLINHIITDDLTPDSLDTTCVVKECTDFKDLNDYYYGQPRVKPNSREDMVNNLKDYALLYLIRGMNITSAVLSDEVDLIGINKVDGKAYFRLVCGFDRVLGCELTLPFLKGATSYKTVIEELQKAKFVKEYGANRKYTYARDDALLLPVIQKLTKNEDMKSKKRQDVDFVLSHDFEEDTNHPYVYIFFKDGSVYSASLESFNRSNNFLGFMYYNHYGIPYNFSEEKLVTNAYKPF